MSRGYLKELFIAGLVVGLIGLGSWAHQHGGFDHGWGTIGVGERFIFYGIYLLVAAGILQGVAFAEEQAWGIMVFRPVSYFLWGFCLGGIIILFFLFL